MLLTPMQGGRGLEVLDLQAVQVNLVKRIVWFFEFAVEHLRDAVVDLEEKRAEKGEERRAIRGGGIGYCNFTTILLEGVQL